jgi:hypothetical protein
MTFSGHEIIRSGGCGVRPPAGYWSRAAQTEEARAPVGTPFTAPVDQLALVVPNQYGAMRGRVGLGVGPWLTLDNHD